MTTLLLILAGLALLTLRPATSDARTPRQIRTALAVAGWPRTLARTLQTIAVAALLATACGMWAGIWIARGIFTVLAAIGLGIAALGGGPELIGGHA